MDRIRSSFGGDIAFLPTGTDAVDPILIVSKARGKDDRFSLRFAPGRVIHYSIPESVLLRTLERVMNPFNLSVPNSFPGKKSTPVSFFQWELPLHWIRLSDTWVLISWSESSSFPDQPYALHLNGGVCVHRKLGFIDLLETLQCVSREIRLTQEQAA